MSSLERVYSLLVQANPIPDPQAVPSVPSPALPDERRSEMLTQEPTETRQIAPKPRWPRAAVAFAATIVIVGAAIGIWALTNSDDGPVAAGDAQIEATFTDDGMAYSGHRQITEGIAKVTIINETETEVWFVVQRFAPGSPELAAELALAPEGGDFVTSDGPSHLVAAFPGIPGESTRSIHLSPGTYILDAGLEEGDLTHVYRAAVIEVVAEE